MKKTFFIIMDKIWYWEKILTIKSTKISKSHSLHRYASQVSLNLELCKKKNKILQQLGGKSFWWDQ